MDLIKIGRYIAGKRKALGMTQRQLAEQLGMSDKSVSKWERGVCLPDVSVYEPLCAALGITINEFLAGEDIPAENIPEKTEENILQLSTESKHRQNRLKRIICALLAVTLAALCVTGTVLLRTRVTENVITPVEPDSTEMNTARLLAGCDGAYMFHYTAAQAFSKIDIIVTTYHAGEEIGKDQMSFSFGGSGIPSPHQGTIAIVPYFDTLSVRLIAAADGDKLSSDFPILEGVDGAAYYGRSSKQLDQAVPIRYDEEQGLAVLVCDNDFMRIGSVSEYEAGTAPAENDYVYFFSVRFSR